VRRPGEIVLDTGRGWCIFRRDTVSPLSLLRGRGKLVDDGEGGEPTVEGLLWAFLYDGRDAMEMPPFIFLPSCLLIPKWSGKETT